MAWFSTWRWPASFTRRGVTFKYAEQSSHIGILCNFEASVAPYWEWTWPGTYLDRLPRDMVRAILLPMLPKIRAESTCCDGNLGDYWKSEAECDAALAAVLRILMRPMGAAYPVELFDLVEYWYNLD